MTIRTAALAAACFLIPAVGAASECPSWQSTMLHADRPSMAITIDSLLDRLPKEPFAVSPDYLAEETRTLDEARDLLVQARHPMPLGDITGAWRVASLQLSSRGAFGYPYFAGRIERDACGFHFAKTTGSQRRTGELLPMEDERTLAFLGTSTVNDDPTAAYDSTNPSPRLPSGSEGPTNSVGRLVRLGPDTLLMILDAHADDNAFELYRLQR